MQPNQTGNLFLRNCSDQTTIIALSALSIVVWGAIFPITLFAAMS